MAKVHWSSGAPGESGLYEAACGWLCPSVASSPEEVTCLVCRRHLPTAITDFASSYVGAVFDGASRVEVVEPLEGELPVLTPGTYKRRQCTCGAHDCEVCHYFARLERERFIRPWLERARGRSGTARFGSLSSALRFYLEALDAGLPLLGSQAEAMLRLGRLGTMVSSSSSSSPTLETVDDFLEVQASLRRAYSDYDFGLSIERCARVLLLSSVGRRVAQKSGRIIWRPVATEELAGELELEIGKVRAIVRHGRRRVTVDLRGRGILR